ncbi:hypothetical protein [Sphaerisporangium album]|uniref:hypothetical protein n=1 Tax=Sphaerisporangium album TaxID=509200 RepID=UPI0011C04FC3|nr:hypothetical protein [Sphaerisporangium album]
MRLQLDVDDPTGQVSRERYLPYGKRRGADDLPFADRGGVSGRFEWILEFRNGKWLVTHQMFVKHGTINGKPIKP